MISEPFQYTLPQRDPFSALDTCTRLIRATDGRDSVVSDLTKSRLVTIFPKVMDRVYRHKGSDSQTTINMVYSVRPPPEA